MLNFIKIGDSHFGTFLCQFFNMEIRFSSIVSSTEKEKIMQSLCDTFGELQDIRAFGHHW